MAACASFVSWARRWLAVMGLLGVVIHQAAPCRGQSADGPRQSAASVLWGGSAMDGPLYPSTTASSPQPSAGLVSAGAVSAGETSGATYSTAAPSAESPLAWSSETARCLQQSGTSADCQRCWEIGGVVRGYYLNDQRLQWSGQESTFGAEGIITPMVRHDMGHSQLTVEGEFYLNQRFDHNVLLDTAERQSYAAHWEVDTFEISELTICLQREAWSLKMGKMETPFGRFYEPLYSNLRIDAPFIRTESILWRETGVLLRYQPGAMVADLAITNGCEDCDTNSMKALVSRVGLENEVAALGFSVKVQDGIGSELQKEYKSHVGVDAMARCGRWVLSGEAIYDQYGFHRPGYDPDQITWERSIYYRDLNRANKDPLTGVGYYASLGYCGERWQTWFNYGEFYPCQIGMPQHDITKRRGYVKVGYSICEHLQVFGVVMAENGGWTAQDGRPRRGNMLLTGLQYVF